MVRFTNMSRTRCTHITRDMNLSRVCRDKHTNKNGNVNYNPNVCRCNAILLPGVILSDIT